VAADGRADGSMVRTGIDGLDQILNGGLPRDRVYLIQGDPGAGKTTLALQFLREGVRSGETALYITLSETEDELRQMAASHGWSLDGLTIFEPPILRKALLREEENTLFHPSDVELGETMRSIFEEFERVRPTRVVIDSLSEIRLLSQSALRYRRQILALKQFFSGRHVTVVLLDDRNASDDLQVQSVPSGVIQLQQLPPEYGSDRRRLRVVKVRGIAFAGGYHDFSILRGGLSVYPRLTAAEHREETQPDSISSGIAELDALLGGGIQRGTSTLITGAAGTGKSALACHFVHQAAEQGEPAAMFLFDERRDTLLARSSALGLRLERHLESGLIALQQVDPAELAPGEFVHRVREEVEERNARVILIDSLNGYLNSMPGDRFLLIQLHELLTYLGHRGVATILVSAGQGLFSTQPHEEIDVSYLADSVIVLRYFEAHGEVRKAIAVVKKRSGRHETSIRELRLGAGGIQLSEPLREFRGVLHGVPVINELAS
jgi:circadian clock protein KaiC